MSMAMLHLYQLVTSFGTMAFFFTVLWTLHVDIKLIKTATVDVRNRADLSLLRNHAKFGFISETSKRNRSCENNSAQNSPHDDVDVFTVILDISALNKTAGKKTTKTKDVPTLEKDTTESYWSAFKKSLTSTAIMNSYYFTYMLHPGNICSDNNVFLLVYVHSAPANHKRRMMIRNTWGNPYNIPLLKLKVLFFIGAINQTTNPTLQEALRFEHERYGDIVQGSFVDSYRNLTYKAISALKFVSENCRNVPYVLKTDDDVFVNVFSLGRHLVGETHKNQRTRTKGSGTKEDRGFFLSCLVWYRMRVVRDQGSKWFVSKQTWQEEYFPPYCSGAAYLLTGPTAHALYNASIYTPFFWIDDLYITGMLAMRLGIKHHKFTNAYQLDFTKFYESYQSNPEDGMPSIFSHIDNFNKVGSLWNLIASRRRGVPMKSDGSEFQSWRERKEDLITSLPKGYAASFTQT